MKTSLKLKRRQPTGTAIAEFGAAFVVLVVFFFIPLVNISFIGVRVLIVQGAMQDFVHRLAMSDKRSDSYSMLSTDTWWSDVCNRCGIATSNKQLKLTVCDKNGAKSIWQSTQSIPTNLLPGGTSAPCIYTYQLTANTEIPPVYGGGGPSIPGLTAPVTFTLEAHSNWENLSQNPATQEFYINE